MAYKEGEHPNDAFWWKPLGGLGEVGMNCMLLGFGKRILPIDCGILFADTNNFGIDAVFPDFRQLLEENPPKDWLITHSHEDHIGAIPLLFSLCKQMNIEAPNVWAPPLAYAMIEERFCDERYPGLRAQRDKIKMVEPGGSVDLEDLQVTFVPVRHSTLETCGLHFLWKADGQRPELRAYHSGDFKIDFHEFEDGTIALPDLPGGNPDILFLDSTNSNRQGQSVSELEIVDGLEELVENSPGRVFVTLFSSNIYRMATMFSIAQRQGRKVLLAGRSLQTSYRLATQLKLWDKCPSFDPASLVDAPSLVNLDPKKQMVLCSGSQGEHRSVLARLAKDHHPELHMEEGDHIIFSSKVIPGNEKEIYRMISNLMRAGAKVSWQDVVDKKIHASGHARKKELTQLLDHLKPKHMIAVHGSYYQLRACADLAQDLSTSWPHQTQTYVNTNEDELEFCHENGEWIIASRKAATEEYPARFLRFNSFATPSRDPFLLDRKRAAQHGVLSIGIHPEVGTVSVRSRGVIPEFLSAQPGWQDFEDEIENHVHKRLSRKRASSGDNWRQWQKELEEELRGICRREFLRRPLVIVHILH